MPLTNMSTGINMSTILSLSGLSNNLSSVGTAVASSEACEALRNIDKEAQRQQLLTAARASAEDWAATTRSISVANCALDVLLLCLLVLLRRHRPIQKQGFGFLACVLFGCFCGHIVSILDAYAPSAQLCRGRLAVIYLFIYGLLAPLIGKLASLCRAAQNVLLLGHSTGWDPVARKTTGIIYATQVLALALYLSLTAGKKSREVRRSVPARLSPRTLIVVPRTDLTCTCACACACCPHGRIGCKRSALTR